MILIPILIPIRILIIYDTVNHAYTSAKSELKRRLYQVEDSKLIPETVPAPDANRFRQCYRCGDIVPLFNVKQESSLVDFVEPTLNPFDDNADNMEGFTPGIGKSNRLNKSKSIYKRKKEYIDSIKDEDIRKELAAGNTLISYFED